MRTPAMYLHGVAVIMGILMIVNGVVHRAKNKKYAKKWLKMMVELTASAVANAAHVSMTARSSPIMPKQNNFSSKFVHTPVRLFMSSVPAQRQACVSESRSRLQRTSGRQNTGRSSKVSTQMRMSLHYKWRRKNKKLLSQRWRT